MNGFNLVVCELLKLRIITIPRKILKRVNDQTADTL
jgi:hypothetical protein